MTKETQPDGGRLLMSGAVSVAAGQLRNPLATIRNAISILESASGLPEARERDLLAQLREILAAYGGASIVRLPDFSNIRRGSLPGKADPAPDLLQGGLAAWQCKRVRDYIEKNLGERLSVRDIASVARLSPSHFSRAFKRSFGMSAHVYLMHRRVAMAQHLMLSTEEALGAIAVICGMSDQSHLTRWFRRVSGATPNSWRRARRGAPECVGITRSDPAPEACEAAKTRT